MKAHLAPSLSLLKFRTDWPEVQLQHPYHVKVASRLSGVCGTDLHQIHVNMSYFASLFAQQQKYISLGHEVVGEVEEIGELVTRVHPGDRVILNPVPHCEVIDPTGPLCNSCSEGNWEQCKVLSGRINPSFNLDSLSAKEIGGLITGGYDEKFLAFQGQLYSVPSPLPDELAVLTEPFAVALHAVLRNPPRDSETILVIGAGIIGLLTVAAIRALGFTSRIIILTRYEFQETLARRMGASDIIRESKTRLLYSRVAELCGALLYTPMMSGPVIYGGLGVDRVYDSVGTERTIDDAIHLTRSNGIIIVIGLGMIHSKHIDWAIPIYKELTIRGSMMHGLTEFRGEQIDPFRFALDYMNQHQVLFAGLCSHRFPIAEYKHVFKLHKHKQRDEVIKLAFDWCS